MILTILGIELPGTDCAGLYTGVQVGVQRGKDSEQLVPADAASVQWDLPIEAKGEADALDVRGPHVQGRPGTRFVYLVWEARHADGRTAMFRRLKIPLEPAADGPFREALLADGSATIRLALTGADGTPHCGGLKPAALDWV